MEETWYTLQYRMIICAEFADLAQNGPINAIKYMNFNLVEFLTQRICHYQNLILQ